MPLARTCLTFLAVLTCASAPSIVHARSALAGDLRKDIRQRYEGKLLLLSTPSSFDIIHFDVEGHPTRPPTGEPWTTCGLLQAGKVEVRDYQVTIEGLRVVVALNREPSSTKLVPVTTDREVHVAIEMPRSIRDVTDLHKFLSRIFSVDDPAQRIANAWRTEVDLSRDPENVSTLPPDGRIGTLEGGRAVYSWESGVVSKPKAVYKPGPKYSATALLKHVSGIVRVRVVVNEKGFPEILEVVQHLREGLDLRALSAVSQWRFEPPLKNGVAAATMVVVQLKFSFRGAKT
jgi:TonB family protein